MIMTKSKKRQLNKTDATDNEQKLAKQAKSSLRNGGKSRQTPASRKSVKVEEPLQPKPRENQDISSNWKSFLQTAVATSARAPAAPAGAARAKRRATGLERRGCTCSRDVWFDGVDPALLDPADKQVCAFCARLAQQRHRQQKKLERQQTEDSQEMETLSTARTPQPSRCLAMDCEMVGVGYSGQESMLARVSLVNTLCQPVYDRYVRPKERVTDYRTAVSGIRPRDLVKGAEFETVQREVADLLKGRVLVGHAVHNDLQALLLSHPKRHTRDTARYPPFRKMFNGRVPSLKNLAHRLLAVDIQRGEHDSVQDARATMQIYQTHRREWESNEAERSRRRHGRPNRPTADV